VNRRILSCLIALFVLGLIPLGTSAAPPEKKLKAVLWVGGFAHDFDAFAKIVAETVPKHLPIEIEVVRDGSFLDRPGAERLDVILMNHCHKSTKGVLSESQKEKLLKLVRGGTGVVAMHASYYSFLKWDEVRKLYGPRFTKHGKVDVYVNVRLLDKDHPVTKGLTDFESHSELYQSTPLPDDCHLLAVAKEKGTEKEYPSVWTRNYGKGRVVTILIAHWPDAYRVEQFQKLIANSARWAAQESD